MGSVLTPTSPLPAYLAWAQGHEWQDLPPAVRHRAALVLADNLAAMASAADEPQVVALRRALSGQPGSVTVWSADRPRLAMPAAALANGVAMGWNELDEGNRKVVCHAGLYVLPALLAQAEQMADVTVADVLRALVLGYDAVARIARTWRFPAMLLHPHAFLAPVGAAAGVGFLLRLPPETLLGAISGATAMGMTGPFNQALKGTLVRNAWAGHGAVTGLNAVMLAQCGIGGGAHTPHDVYTALGASANADELDVQATPGWAIQDGYHKMNACCQYAHSSIDAVQQILAQQPALLGGQGIDCIEVQVHPLGQALDNATPETTLAAKFSVPHAVAAAFVHGDGAVAAFDASSLHDPRIAALRPKVQLSAFAPLKPWPLDRPAMVRVHAADGQRYEATCWSARGGPDRPYGEAELWDKVRALSGGVMPGAAAVLHGLAQQVQRQDAGATQAWPGFVDALYAASPSQ